MEVERIGLLEKKNDIKVSIIVPVYNEEFYLYDCVNSIINQTYRNLDIILVDDGSKENVARDCDLLAQKDGRIKVIHKENHGLSAARLSGIDIAVGDYIMFVDNDDIIAENTVEILLNSAFDADIVVGRSIDLVNVSEFSSNNKTTADYTLLTGKEVCEWMAVDREKKIITPLWGKLYSRDYISKIDLRKYEEICPTIYFEDVLMTPILYRMAEKVSIVDEALYVHREIETSISHARKLSSYYYEQIESGNILLDFCKSNDIPLMFQFELEIYYRVLLRIWCLIPNAELDDTTKEGYKLSIKKYYKKYFKDMMRSKQSLFRKIFYMTFLVNKDLWGTIVYRLYFKKDV